MTTRPNALAKRLATLNASRTFGSYAELAAVAGCHPSTAQRHVVALNRHLAPQFGTMGPGGVFLAHAPVEPDHVAQWHDAPPINQFDRESLEYERTQALEQGFACADLSVRSRVRTLASLPVDAYGYVGTVTVDSGRLRLGTPDTLGDHETDGVSALEIEAPAGAQAHMFVATGYAPGDYAGGPRTSSVVLALDGFDPADPDQFDKVGDYTTNTSLFSFADAAEAASRGRDGFWFDAMSGGYGADVIDTTPRGVSAFAVSAGYGDGTYDVETAHDTHGTLTAVRVTFFTPEDDLDPVPVDGPLAA